MKSIELRKNGKPITLTAKEQKFILDKIRSEINEGLKKKTFVVIKSTLPLNALSALLTYGGLIGVLAINHYKFNDSVLGAFLLGFVFIVNNFLYQRRNAVILNGREDMVEFVKQNI